MYTLKGRTAVIAGATGHVGAGAVRMLTAAGMNVVMVTHNMADAGRLIAEVEDNLGTCIALSNEDGDGAVYGEVYRRFGSVDVIIPNQGAAARRQDLSDITEEELDGKLHHQITGSFTMVQKAIPYLKKSRAGRVILVSGTGAENGLLEEGLLECAARGGVISMTRYLARELAVQGITVNCIARGGMENDHAPEGEDELDNRTLVPRIPVRRNGTPEEFGAVVCYLASEEAGFMTGQVLRLNGGLFMG